MEHFATVIVVFGIISLLSIIATVTFVCIDKNAKEEYKWVWIVLAFLGPVALIPYFIWGRER